MMSLSRCRFDPFKLGSSKILDLAWLRAALLAQQEGNLKLHDRVIFIKWL